MRMTLTLETYIYNLLVTLLQSASTQPHPNHLKRVLYSHHCDQNSYLQARGSGQKMGLQKQMDLN